MRVVVCGTIFGQVYLEALRSADLPFELAGILCQGSERSRLCARRLGVPVFTHPDEIPDRIDIACIVVRSGLLGGRGTELAHRLMERGIHILQEHPLHFNELAECLRHARRRGLVYHLNSFYVHVAPVRRFVAAARQLLRSRQLLYVDACCGFQVAYALLDILASAIGGVRPWVFSASASSDGPGGSAGDEPPFRSLSGLLAGVPATLRIQNQLDPGDPDNFAHVLHRVCLGTESGSLMLVDTHGPTVWCERPGFPREVREPGARPHFADLGGPPGDGGPPCTTVLGPATYPSYEQIFRSLWPDGVRRALLDVRRAILESEDPLPRGQGHLTLCQLWQDLTANLGPPRLHRAEPPRLLSVEEHAAMARAAGSEG
jgi:pyochelin biosynthesis protein PchG